MNIQNFVNNLNINKVAQLQILNIVAKYNINSKLRLAHFVSQTAYESLNYTTRVENLNYSANNLVTTFYNYFNSEMAEKFAYKPIEIGNIVYANRMGNGNYASGDGYLYRGRGYLQLTGKNNYTSFGEFIGVDLISNPDLVATDYPMESAIWFFHANNLWQICDKGANDDAIMELTKRINGGLNGINNRMQNFYTFYNLLKF